MGRSYRPPKADHDYKIRYAPKLPKYGDAGKAVTYMTAIVQRAKSAVDPQKYAAQYDWKRRSKEGKPNISLSKSARMTFTAETMKIKKKLPAPNTY